MISESEITQSMSRPGKCIDNGPMESFWSFLKTEMYYFIRFDNFDMLCAAVSDYNKKLLRLSGTARKFSLQSLEDAVIQYPAKKAVKSGCALRLFGEISRLDGKNMLY